MCRLCANTPLFSDRLRSTRGGIFIRAVGFTTNDRQGLHKAKNVARRDDRLWALWGVVETTMLSSLPPEILDLIVDHLRDNPSTLKTCCLVSKSWIPRTRRHLFTHVEFKSVECSPHLWMKTFPDPSNSPACYTRNLEFTGPDTITAATTCAFAWICHFSNIVELRMRDVSLGNSIPIPLVQLHGLSPTLKFLHLYHLSIPLSELLALICSFPLLEDIWLHSVITTGDADGSDIPLTSPRLTGTVSVINDIRSVVRGLLRLPHGPNFSGIAAVCRGESAEFVNDLVLRCSDTVESLVVAYYTQRTFPWGFRVYCCLLPLIAPPSPLVLSKATKLHDIEFRCIGQDIRWIITTLRSAETINLKQIVIVISPYSTFDNPVGEMTRQEWQELDHLLVRLWTSSSVRPVIICEERGGGNNWGEVVLSLLPQLAGKRAVEVGR